MSVKTSRRLLAEEIFKFKMRGKKCGRFRRWLMIVLIDYQIKMKTK